MYEENCGLSNVLMSWGHDGQHHLNLLFAVVPAIILINTVEFIEYSANIHVHVISCVSFRIS